MPVEFLPDAQIAAYGRFAGPPSRAQLERFFFLDDADRKRIDQRRPGPRRDSRRLGFAVQLGTVRFLGTFLADPLDVPREVVAYVAGQLGITEPAACFAASPERAMTPYEHAWEIRRVYDYRDFAAGEPGLRAFLAARVWTSTEGPLALFERATAWLLEQKVLLPGATTLAKLVAAVRAEAAERLWGRIDRAIEAAARRDPALRGRLYGLLAADEGGRLSRLERLRTPPRRLSGPALVRALARVTEVRDLGAGAVDLAGLPANRLAALARYGLLAKAPQLRQLTEPRRTATLLVTARQLEQRALDDALDLLDGLLATTLFARAAREARESAREQVRTLVATLGRLATASATLAAVIQFLLDALATDDALPLAEAWAQLERRLPRDAVEAAVADVLAHAPPPDAAAEDADAAWRAELVTHYGTVRPVLPHLTAAIPFGAVPPGQPVLAALRRLPDLVERAGKAGRTPARRAAFAGELAEAIATDLVTGSWKRLVYAQAARGSRTDGTDGRPGGAPSVDLHAYVLCVFEHLHRALRRRDVFALGSDRWSDPRARLLDGEAWAAVKPAVLTGLGLPEDPQPHLTELATTLDTVYREVAGRVPEHPALEVTADRDGRERLHLARLTAAPEPASLVALRKRLARMLPRVELPELLLEVQTWTGYLDDFTHVSEADAALEDLPLSVAAVLVAEACNLGFRPLGFRPVAQDETAALTPDRLSHVDQNYVRAETLRAANARLIAAQAAIPLAQTWGGGLVASVDGLRFVVPVTTIHAGPNPRYFDVRRGVTWLNAMNDQRAGTGALVVPGTLRDSLYTLHLVLNLDGGPRPRMIVTDAASYSDIVFGLFRLLGYQFAPRLADLPDLRFWRVDAPGYPGHGAAYGPLDGVARSRINLGRVRAHWPDMLRVAGSLVTGAVRAYDLLRMLGRDGHPSALGQAVAEYGRLPKTLHLLAYVDVDDAYRRQIGAHLNLHESRQRLARRICHGQKGELRQPYREGQEDQLGALGLVLNAVVLWNTRYLDAALTRLRREGYPVRDEDVVRLAPFRFAHLNFHGRYTFTPFTPPGPGLLRPLRDPDAGDDEEDE